MIEQNDPVANVQFSSLSEIETSLGEFTDRADSRIEGVVDAMLQGAALLAEGINPTTQERLWDLENIKYKLSYLVTQIYKESYEIGTEEFPVLLKETAISSIRSGGRSSASST